MEAEHEINSIKEKQYATDLNMERLRGEMDSGMERMRGEMNAGFARMEGMFGALSAKMDGQIGNLRVKMTITNSIVIGLTVAILATIIIQRFLP